MRKILLANVAALSALSNERTFTDASFPNGLAPIIKTSSTRAWIHVGLASGF